MVEPGGCAGMKYMMGLVRHHPTDVIVNATRQRSMSTNRAFSIWRATTVDFVVGLEGAGFTFDNPLAASNGSCGKSSAERRRHVGIQRQGQGLLLQSEERRRLWLTANAVARSAQIATATAWEADVEDDPVTQVILDARFQTYGCGSAIASSSALTGKMDHRQDR